MKQKLVVVISVFLLLFTGAWIIDQRSKRRDEVPIAETNVLKVKFVSDQKQTIHRKQTKPFAPREYVRISNTY
ncbi:hypothetical protein [Bacillus sp. 03113]|uniref:hypothetical protein n=1 Tax=Bacillus sp. 03113 TaxID=2578211 RepID=UPI001141364E|nr:hypothetical protein [Bacillus sp. 03113]